MALQSDRIRPRVYEWEYDVIDDRLLDFCGELGSHVHSRLCANFEIRNVSEKQEAWRDGLRMDDGPFNPEPDHPKPSALISR